ncbi:MAG: hypothetical protein LZF86_190471 [Nitrospira sp.]|nr:MAG: hypothetical protein LZF86_190471 [Nitrospira sp.]
MTKTLAGTGPRLNLSCLGGANVSGWTETPEAPDLKILHAKIGQLALEDDFFGQAASAGSVCGSADAA